MQSGFHYPLIFSSISSIIHTWSVIPASLAGFPHLPSDINPLGASAGALSRRYSGFDPLSVGR
jgi:hypothetical protein